MAIQNIEPNALGMMMANALRKGKEGLNAPGKLPEKWPLVGGMGAGDLLFGKGPELAESMAHGFSPLRGSGTATSVDPRVMDLAMTPLPMGLLTKGAGMATQKLTAKLLRDAAEGATDVGRREFMKKAGAGTAAVGAAAVVPDLAKALLKHTGPVAEEMAPKVAEAAGVQVAKAGIPATWESLLKNYKTWAAKEGQDWVDSLNVGSNSGLDGSHLHQVHKSFAEEPISPEILKQAIGDIPPEQVRPDLLSHFFKMEPATDRIPITGDAAAYEKEYQRVSDLQVKAYERAKNDPEFLKHVEDYHITGKLPPGAPPDAQYVNVTDFPPHSRLTKLWQSVASRYNELEDGMGGNPFSP